VFVSHELRILSLCMTDKFKENKFLKFLKNKSTYCTNNSSIL
jgi:hypothetical protein